MHQALPCLQEAKLSKPTPAAPEALPGSVEHVPVLDWRSPEADLEVWSGHLASMQIWHLYADLHPQAGFFWHLYPCKC